MNYNDNEDELLRMRARHKNRRTGSDGTASSRSKAVFRESRSHQRSFDSIDDAYFKDEYGYEEDGLDIPFSEKPSVKPSGSFHSTGSSRSHSRSRVSGTSKKTGKSGGSSGHRNSETEERYRHHSSRQKGRKRKKRWPMLVLLFLAAFTAYGSWLYFHRPTGTWTVAVFGVDSRDGNTKKALADVQMICTLDRETGEIRLASVFRDTYLKIDSKGTYHKINEAYFKGGQKQAVDALEENLDLKIDDYAAFNWKAVAEAINVLGGIDLEITPAEFKYINGFITETVNSTGIGSVQLKQAGPNHLDGVQAVAYSRLRLMDTDFQRTQRQRKVIALSLEKARQADAGTLTNLAKAILPQISTSIGIDDVLPLIKDIDKYHITDTAGFPFSRETKRIGKMDCVIATTLESNVVQLHQFLYGEDTLYHPSSQMKKISAHISEETGLYEEGTPAPVGTSSGSGKTGSDKGGAGNPGKSEDSRPQETTQAASLEESEETQPKEESSSSDETEETISIKESEEETKEDDTIKGSRISGPGSTEKEDSNHLSEDNISESEAAAGSPEESKGPGPDASPDQQPGNGPGISGFPGVSKDTEAKESVSAQGPGV